MSQGQETGFDPGSRELCPDGMCIGVIGADGQCKVCGQRSLTGLAAPPVVTDPKVEPEAAAPAPAEPGPPLAVEGDAFDPARRELCPDGMCLGVIGADGRCGVCGTPRGG